MPPADSWIEPAAPPPPAMDEVEITEIPPLQPNEKSLLEMHSLLNILNVLRGELSLIGLALANDDTLLQESHALCRRLIVSLCSMDGGLAMAGDMDLHQQQVLGEIEEAFSTRPAARDNLEVTESVANLRSAFAILRVRAREVLARFKHPERWVYCSGTRLRCEIHDVMLAMERTSRHRFRVVYNPALQRPTDYYLDLQIDGSQGDHLWMPPVIKDVLRDLIANARKYTPPGGRITAALHARKRTLRLVVEDTGRGIPPREIATVVHFGRRASNVADVRTMGGGFGLTKAFFVAKQFGGRFWIASKLGVGTRIRLEIPAPRSG
ncbi:ATP-binding protein [Opitutus terrae]|nr:ATP-binding protein [Opitutus terrae]